MDSQENKTSKINHHNTDCSAGDVELSYSFAQQPGDGFFDVKTYGDVFSPSVESSFYAWVLSGHDGI